MLQSSPSIPQHGSLFLAALPPTALSVPNTSNSLSSYPDVALDAPTQRCLHWKSTKWPCPSATPNIPSSMASEVVILLAPPSACSKACRNIDTRIYTRLCLTSYLHYNTFEPSPLARHLRVRSDQSYLTKRLKRFGFPCRGRRECTRDQR